MGRDRKREARETMALSIAPAAILPLVGLLIGAIRATLLEG